MNDKVMQTGTAFNFAAVLCNFVNSFQKVEKEIQNAYYNSKANINIKTCSLRATLRKNRRKTYSVEYDESKELQTLFLRFG
jgi:hypothetical protein